MFRTIHHLRVITKRHSIKERIIFSMDGNDFLDTALRVANRRPRLYLYNRNTTCRCLNDLLFYQACPFSIPVSMADNIRLGIKCIIYYPIRVQLRSTLEAASVSASWDVRRRKDNSAKSDNFSAAGRLVSPVRSCAQFFITVPNPHCAQMRTQRVRACSPASVGQQVAGRPVSRRAGRRAGSAQDGLIN